MDLPSAVGMLSTAIIAVALWLSLRLVYSGRRSGDAVHILLRIVVAVLLLSTVAGLCIDLLGGDLGVLFCLTTLIVWGIVVFRLRRTQRQMFVDLLALTAERSLPIAPVMRAMAIEEHGAIGYRAGEFADRLDAGYQVAQALLATRGLLAPQDQLAIEIGQQTGSLPITLQTLAGDPIAPGRAGESIWIGSIGLVAMANMLLTCVLFVSVKIVPAYEKIFVDFRDHGRRTGYPQLRFPPITQFLFSVFHTIFDLLAKLAYPLAVVVPLLTFYVVAYLMGWWRFELPLVNRFFAPRHSAIVLRWFAAAVRREQSLWPILRESADRYPNRLIRSRLRWASRQIDAGQDWITSFRDNRLIGRTDAALLRAASKAGNLAWALEEAAAANLRRLSYRLEAISQVLMPIAIILGGVCVLVFALGMFLPLVSLISELAK